MRIPIDTSNLTLMAGKIEQALDFETKRPKADANGEPIYMVDLVVIAEGSPQIWPVKVSGEPKGVAVGQLVKVSGLVAAPWSMEGRSGVSFRADTVLPAPAGSAAVPGPSAKSAA
jgi:hypothetical protein